MYSGNLRRNSLVHLFSLFNSVLGVKIMERKNKLLEGLDSEANRTLTENLAETYVSTLDPVLDFFSRGGALRTREPQSIISLFSKAFAANKLLALRALFYFRDIRQGQGERKTFRVIWGYLAKNYPDIFVKNVKLVPEYGRWDDIFSGMGSNKKTREAVISLIKSQLATDMSSLKEKQPVSLLAKWLKSENAGTMANIYAKEMIKMLDVTPRKYRKTLSALRKHIKIVESQMCANEWTKINYENVPSKASMIYGKAFRRHNEDGYQAYLDAVKKGEKKIQTKAIFPYELLRKAKEDPSDLETLTIMWDNLPDYCVEGEENSIVVCDTSGSMTGLPMDVSTSLAMYFAERNKGIWNNKFITFSKNPAFQTIVGSNLYEKYNNLNRADWDQNTDLIKVFKLILDTAIHYSVPEEDMLKKIYIVSDMEFDSATKLDPNNLNVKSDRYEMSWGRGSGRLEQSSTNYQTIKQMYESAGYKIPMLVFWNVDSRHDQSPITISDNGVLLVSGCSPTIFKNLMNSKITNAVDMMLEVLNSERYEAISI